METNKLNERRQVIRDLLELQRFKHRNALEKVDEFRYSEDQFLYFYWPQGGDVNFAIDPRLDYDQLLDIEGVTLQKTPRGEGLRVGSAMKQFPGSYLGLTPKNKSERVGRMFNIVKPSVPKFLDGLLQISNLSKSNASDKAISSKEIETLPPSPIDSALTHVEAKSEVSPNSSQQVEIGTSDARSGGAADDLQADVNKLGQQIDTDYLKAPGSDVDAIVKRRVGQGPFRSLLIAKYGCECSVSGIKNESLLIASHIVPWSESTADQKTDPDNGLLLSVTWDALFDKGFVSFDDNGNLMRSKRLDVDTVSRLGVTTDVNLPKKLLKVRRRKNLAKHREKFESLNRKP